MWFRQTFVNLFAIVLLLTAPWPKLQNKASQKVNARKCCCDRQIFFSPYGIPSF